MDIGALKEKAVQIFSKYKFVFLIVALGIILMLIPPKQESSQQDTEPAAVSQEETTLQSQLEEILSSIEGCGRVKVLLTYSSGEEHIYQQDTDTSSSDSTMSEKGKTVIVAGPDRAEQPLIRQVIPPQCRGAVVVCQGGDSPAVQLAVVQAVISATGLTADKITVLKMK